MTERVIDYSNKDVAVEQWREIIRSYTQRPLGAAALGEPLTYHADGEPMETKT